MDLVKKKFAKINLHSVMKYTREAHFSDEPSSYNQTTHTYKGSQLNTYTSSMSHILEYLKNLYTELEEPRFVFRIKYVM